MYNCIQWVVCDHTVTLVLGVVLALVAEIIVQE